MNKKICLNCRLDEVQDLKHCSRCRIAGYCSQVCQKAAFKDHKKLCKAMSQLVPEFRDEAFQFFRLWASNPTMQFGEFSWAFVRDVMCNNESTGGQAAPEELKKKLMRLKAVACIERNLEAAREYVRAEWIYRHKYAVLLDDFSVVDLPLMLLALGRVLEAENVIKKVFLDFLKVKPCPENPPEKFFSVERYIEVSRSVHTEPEHPSMFYVPMESFLLNVCYGASLLTRSRPAFEAARDTVYDEIFNEESWFSKLQGKDPVVEKILGELERNMVTQFFQWTEQNAIVLHRTNKYILGGIVDPANLKIDQPDWTAAYKQAFWSEDLPPEWRGMMGSYFQPDNALKICAEWILLGAMPISRLAGFYDTLKEVASKVAAA